MAMIHISRAGGQLGAFPEDEVRTGLASGRFLPSDLGWSEGMSEWKALSTFPQFTGVEATPPASGTGPLTEITASATSTLPRSGLPWERRQELGFLNAYIETLKIVLTSPAEAFNIMKREGGLANPLLYALLGGSFGTIAYLLFMFMMPSLASFGGRENPIGHLVGAGIGSVLLIIFLPLFLVIGVFLSAAILHVCLMIVGGANQTFETTFRVVCFSMGSVDPLLIVPFCGGFIVAVWRILLNCIGLARAHETNTGRAVVAVFLPLIVCCGGGILCAFMFGLFGALNQHGQ